MSAAKVTFETLGYLAASPGEEVRFSFQCPKEPRRRCTGLLIKDKPHGVRHDPQNKNGRPQWSWDGNRDCPTFSPSINCGNCAEGWHGFLEKGRCVTTGREEEPEPTEQGEGR